MEFWVYENWAVRKAVIHRGECAYCNHGAGIHGGGRSRNGRWHGPFGTVGEAHNQARQTGQPDRRGCKVCAPPVDP
jgi:F-type H+-transporting ATPase subunit beta